MNRFASIVLLVDPDARHRATASLLLKSNGFSVVAVRNAREALETFEAHHTDIALVIADDQMVCPMVEHKTASVAAASELVMAAGASAPVRRATPARTDEAFALIPELRRVDARVPVLVMAEAETMLRHRDQYRELELAGVLGKPLHPDQLHAVLPPEQRAQLVSQPIDAMPPLPSMPPPMPLSMPMPPVAEPPSATVPLAFAPAPRWQFPIAPIEIQPIDVSTACASVVDAPSILDAGFVDAGIPAAGIPTAGSADSGTADAGLRETAGVTTTLGPARGGAVMSMVARADVRSQRRRTSSAVARRALAAATATLMGLTLTTWLEVRGGAAPEVPPIRPLTLPANATQLRVPSPSSRHPRDVHRRLAMAPLPVATIGSSPRAGVHEVHHARQSRQSRLTRPARAMQAHEPSEPASESSRGCGWIRLLKRCSA